MTSHLSAFRTAIFLSEDIAQSVENAVVVAKVVYVYFCCVLHVSIMAMYGIEGMYLRLKLAHKIITSILPFFSKSLLIS